MNKFIILHVLLSLAYFLLRARTKGRHGQAVCEGILVLLVPGAGVLLLLLVQIAGKLPISQQDPSYMYSRFHQKRPLFKTQSPEEMNVVPVQDLLHIEDIGVKRKLMGEVIRRGALRNNQALANAVRNEDSEVSHYAVSLASSRVEELETSIYQLDKALEQKPDDYGLREQHAQALSHYLALGFLDEASRRKMLYKYAASLNALLQAAHPDKQWFIEKINCELELERLEQAELDCGRFAAAFDRNEEPYLMYIKLYYQQNNPAQLRQTVERLKKADIRFTNKALQVIRFWDGGERSA